MRKYLALLLLTPTAFMVMSGAANAQRKNTTSHDVKPVCDCIGQPDCECSSPLERTDTKIHHEKARKAHDHHPHEGAHKGKKGSKDTKAHQKDKMKHQFADRDEEIEHQYNKAIKKIDEAELSPKESEALKRIAANNRNLAKQQAETTAKQLKSAKAECKKLGAPKKLCKRINKILLNND